MSFDLNLKCSSAKVPVSLRAGSIGRRRRLEYENCLATSGIVCLQDPFACPGPTRPLFSVQMFYNSPLANGKRSEEHSEDILASGVFRRIICLQQGAQGRYVGLSGPVRTAARKRISSCSAANLLRVFMYHLMCVHGGAN